MKKYFVTVQTFSSTTKLGRLVAMEVREKFQHTLISEGQIVDVAAFIKDSMAEHLEQNPKLKEMKVRYLNFIDSFVIDLKPTAADSYDKPALTITGTAVYQDFTEEGGEA